MTHSDLKVLVRMTHRSLWIKVYSSSGAVRFERKSHGISSLSTESCRHHPAIKAASTMMQTTHFATHPQLSPTYALTFCGSTC
jgi:hypothetical protein